MAIIATKTQEPHGSWVFKMPVVEGEEIWLI